MYRSKLLIALGFFAMLVLAPMALQAGSPLKSTVASAAVPAAEVGPQEVELSAAATLVETSGQAQPYSATLIILGLSLILLIPVGLEWVAPQSVSQAFGYRQARMLKRASP